MGKRERERGGREGEGEGGREGEREGGRERERERERGRERERELLCSYLNHKRMGYLHVELTVLVLPKP